MELKDLENLVDTVYRIVGERYSNDFKNIIGGCHCWPATEWYGDIYLAFKKVLKDGVIKFFSFMPHPFQIPHVSIHSFVNNLINSKRT